MTSKTHLLTQLPRRTIKQELICSKASFVDRVRTLKLFQYFQTASWSHWWVRHAGTSARSPPGDRGETKLQPLLLQKKKKNVQSDTKIIEKGKRAAVRDIFLPELAAIVKKRVCAPILVPVSTCEQFSWHMKSSAARTTPISPKPWSSNTAFTARVFICMTLQRGLL